MHAPAPVWPKVLGVLSIFLAGQALFEGAQMDVPFAPLAISRLAAAGLSVENEELALSCLVLLSGIAAHLLVILAGVLLLRRKRIAGALHVVAAVVIILTAPGRGCTIVALLADPVRAALAWAYSLKMILYSVFLLVWFSRARVRKQLRRWRYRRPRPEAPEPAWPTVLAAVSIAWGASAFADVLTAILYTAAAWSKASGNPQLFVFLLGTPVLGVMAVLAGGKLLARNPRASAWHRALAVATLALLLIHALCCARHLATRAGSWRPAFVAVSVVSWAIGAIWLLAYPVFLLIWFARPKIRAQVRSWSGHRP
jgi:hypothetical protein